jgi:hypothetical protein
MECERNCYKMTLRSFEPQRHWQTGLRRQTGTAAKVSTGRRFIRRNQADVLHAEVVLRMGIGWCYLCQTIVLFNGLPRRALHYFRDQDRQHKDLCVGGKNQGQPAIHLAVPETTNACVGQLT